MKEKRDALWKKFFQNQDNAYILGKYELNPTSKELQIGVWKVIDEGDIPLIVSAQIKAWQIFQILWKESRTRNKPILKRSLEIIQTNNRAKQLRQKTEVERKRQELMSKKKNAKITKNGKKAVELENGREKIRQWFPRMAWKPS